MSVSESMPRHALAVPSDGRAYGRDTHDAGPPAATSVHDDAVPRQRGEVVYWIVPPYALQRHGITEKPGALPTGTWVPDCVATT